MFYDDQTLELNQSICEYPILFYCKNKLYEPGKLSKIVDEFISNISQISLKKSDNTIEISLSPQCAYLFLLSKMPKGLPSYFIKLIFKDNYEHELVSQYSNNKWKYINNEL